MCVLEIDDFRNFIFAVKFSDKNKWSKGNKEAICLLFQVIVIRCYLFFFFFLMLIDTLNLAHLLLSKWSNCKISLFMWRRRKIGQTWKSLLQLDNTTTCLDRHDLNFWPILDRMTESCFCPNVIVFSLKPKFYLWRSGTLSKLDF